MTKNPLDGVRLYRHHRRPACRVCQVGQAFLVLMVYLVCLAFLVLWGVLVTLALLAAWVALVVPVWWVALAVLVY
jgi:hypothetical protein